MCRVDRAGIGRRVGRVDSSRSRDAARDENGAVLTTRARVRARVRWSESSDNSDIVSSATGRHMPNAIIRANHTACCRSARPLRLTMRPREPQGRCPPSRGVVSATRGLDPDPRDPPATGSLCDDRPDGQPDRDDLLPSTTHVYRTRGLVSMHAAGKKFSHRVRSAPQVPDGRRASMALQCSCGRWHRWTTRQPSATSSSAPPWEYT